jgi:Uma2 family endonuclease
VQNADRIRDKDDIDLSVDPPPDLVIEIDITSPSLKKFPIFAALGIPEVWRYDGKQVSMWQLAASAYSETTRSTVLPGITSEALNHLLATRAHMKRTAWVRRVREWVQRQGA